MAIIRIHGLKVRSLIGVYERERLAPQWLVIHVELEYDASRAIASDALADAVDYEAICNRLGELAARSRFILLESFAAAALAQLRELPAVTRIALRVLKPAAIPAADAIEVALAYP